MDPTISSTQHANDTKSMVGVRDNIRQNKQTNKKGNVDMSMGDSQGSQRRRQSILTFLLLSPTVCQASLG